MFGNNANFDLAFLFALCKLAILCNQEGVATLLVIKGGVKVEWVTRGRSVAMRPFTWRPVIMKPASACSGYNSATNNSHSWSVPRASLCPHTDCKTLPYLGPDCVPMRSIPPDVMLANTDMEFR